MVWSLPFASQVGLSIGDHGVSCQHFKGAGFACSIDSQQTKALKEKINYKSRKSSSLLSKLHTVCLSLMQQPFVAALANIQANKSVSYLSRRDANTQPIHSWLLFPLVNLSELSELQDVRLSSPTQDPLSLSGHILIFFSNRFQMTDGWPGRSHAARSQRVTSKIECERGFGLYRCRIFSSMLRWPFNASMDDDPPGLKAEVVLNEDSDAEEDNAFYGHCKQVFPNHVPGQRRAEPIFTYSRTTWKHF